MTFNEFFRRFLAILFVLLLWAGIWAARSTLILGFAAALIAVAISILSVWLQRRGWRRGLAIMGSVFTVGIVAIFLLLLVLPRLINELITLLGSIPEAISSLVSVYASLRSRSPFLRAALPPIAPVNVGPAEIEPEAAQAILTQLINASLAIAPSLLGGVSVVVAVLINLAFVLFIAIFFLVDPKTYVKASLFLLPQRYHLRIIHIWNELYRTIKLWVTTLLLSISITVGLVWLILGVLLNMPNAIVVAVFAGLATFIPNIGSFLPLIPITIFTLANDPTQLIIMVPVYLAIQLVESNVITPSLVKSELHIPAGALMLFQLLATLAFGALGLLLAVPMFAIIVVLVREIYSYDILKLRHLPIVIASDDTGAVHLLAQPLPASNAQVEKSRHELNPESPELPPRA